MEIFGNMESNVQFCDTFGRIILLDKISDPWIAQRMLKIERCDFCLSRNPRSGPVLTGRAHSELIISHTYRDVNMVLRFPPARKSISFTSFARRGDSERRRICRYFFHSHCSLCTTLYFPE
jgi:hypothetical protein